MIRLFLIFVLTIVFAASSFAQQVNKFNGSMNYSENLLTVPSNTGSGVPIGISYQPGVTVHQEASEIGLGWGLGIGGAITRNVSGVPDDCDGCFYLDFKTHSQSTQYGAMYLKNGITQSSYGQKVDINESRYQSDSIDYFSVDYDNYSIAGPGISGSLNANLFDYGKIKANQTNGGFDVSSFTKKMQFSFNSDFHDTLISRHYPAPINGSTAIKLPGSNVTDYYTNDSRPYMGAKYNGSGSIIGDENFNHTTNRLVTPNYVEYFTNAEITAGVANFINFESGHSRSGARYDGMQNAIGAYRITDAMGYTYHYSLPVYVNKTLNYILPINTEYSLESAHRDLYQEIDPSISHISKCEILPNLENFIEYRDEAKYAYQWLLTAVTGSDYIDINENGMVDEGDNGYWVFYDYKLWSSNYLKRTPAFGYNSNYNYTPSIDKVIDVGNVSWGNYSSNSVAGVITVADMEIFYLNSIKTTSHTALLVREPRKDEYSKSTDYDASLKFNRSYSTGTNPVFNFYSYNGKSGYNHSSAGGDSRFNIRPTDAQAFTINVTSVSTGMTVYVKENNDSGTLLATITSTSVPTTINVNSPIAFVKAVPTGAQSFSFNWKTTTKRLPFPTLSVNKILLLKNSDLVSMPTLTSFNAPSGFSLTGTNNAANQIYNNDWYTANKTAIDALTLQTVEFTQDYSLSKKYYNNINSIFPDSIGLNNWNQVAPLQTIQSGQSANSGKLTLKEINIFGLNHTKTLPSFQFDYNDGSSTDNPDYDPRSADYWGYYKSDFAAPALSRYTTSTSKDYTDAWSLRKITLPSGGTIEFTYESNEYQKVWKEKGGYKGASKIYPIVNGFYYEDNSNESAGKKWQIRMENPTVSDFTSLVNSPPTGTTRFVFLPFHNGNNYQYIAQGSFHFKTSPLRITNIEKIYYSTINRYKYNVDADSSKVDPPSPADSNQVAYLRNGFIMFELPQTYTTYGGGIRTKSITSRNGSGGEAYVREYTYENGVATCEADRFKYPKQYRDWNRGDLMHQEITSFSVDKFGMAPSVGYGKVTEKNMGLINSALGSTISCFNTSNSEMEADVLNVQARSTTYGNIYCHSTMSTDTSYLVELHNRGKGFWGILKEEKITDINNVVLSTSKYEYAVTNQGAISEVLDAQNVNGYNYCLYRDGIEQGDANCSTCNRFNHTITIIRDYRIIPIKQTSYTPGGGSSYSITLKTDEITGQATESFSSSLNKSTQKQRIIPAFRLSNYTSMGPKALNSTYTNQLNLVASTNVKQDTTISGGSDFIQQTAATYSQTFNRRFYDLEGGYTTSSADYGFWLNSTSYNWVGTTGSINTYGLFKGSELSTYPFNYTTPTSSNLRWRFAGQVNLLDSKTHVLENLGYNNIYNATRYDMNENVAIAQVNNCNYASFAFAGFEESKTYNNGVSVVTFYESEIAKSSYTSTQTNGARTAHTGSQFVSVTNGDGPQYTVKFNGFGSKGEELGLLRGRRYRASVWIHSDSPSDAKLVLSLNGTSGGNVITTTTQIQKNDSKAVQVGNWYLVWVDLEVPKDYTSTGGSSNNLRVYVNSGTGTAYFDDLQFHPVESGFTAKIIDQKTGWTVADLSNDTYATKYIYDNSGRVTEVWQEIPGSGLKKIKSSKINFGRGLN
jgi:hypothetical protein